MDVRAVSADKAKLNRQRRKLIERTEPQSCNRCNREPAVDHHELTRRSQSSTSAIDLDEMIPIGRQCHDWIGRNPAQAVLDGWAKWSHPDRVPPKPVQWRPPLALDSADMQADRPRAVRKITWRMTENGYRFITAHAVEQKVKPSAVIRAALSIASRHPDEIVAYINAHRGRSYD